MGTVTPIQTAPAPRHQLVRGTRLSSGPGRIETLLETVDLWRLEASGRFDEGSRGEMGQFLTAAPVARLMASMFDTRRRNIRLLDPGAGVGSLSAAFVEAVCRSHRRPDSLDLTAYELDASLVGPLQETLDACRALCRQHGVCFTARVQNEDFVTAGAAMLGGNLFDHRERQSFDCIILNPPYRKIHSDSKERQLLRNIGVETSNLYTGFLAIALKLLVAKGEMVAITPRSFCNGTYFKPFRRLFLDNMALRRFHLFESRSRAFETDRVLQENVIFHAVKGKAARRRVVITSNEAADDEHCSVLHVAYDELIQPGDPDCFIRLMTDELQRHVALRMSSFNQRLQDLGLAVSTGRVVDFRAREFLRERPAEGTAPLIYPAHFNKGLIEWPREGSRKPNAIAVSPRTRKLLTPEGTYVLTKRFSAKEERRRIVAAVYTARQSGGYVGFENHLNYYHRNGEELPPKLAKGLALFLNSTLVDSYFRQFNGHTQVNATDLRSLRYPTLSQLEALGSRVKRRFPDQSETDRIVEEELFPMPDDAGSMNPVAAKKKIDEALAVLRDFGLPKEQQNERSALTLLSLLDLDPKSLWSKASAPLRGITQMMDFFAAKYGKRYAPNTRETIRKHSVHQFVQAGLALKNPDDPARPVNSPKTVYQIAPIVLALLHTYGTKQWKGKLKAYVTSAGTLSRYYARERQMNRLPVKIAHGKTITLSPGGHSELVKSILDDFCALFTPGAKVVYVGDTEKKWAFFDHGTLDTLGVRIEEHGKMPDVVVHDADREWLVLIEAVTSHGAIDAKRHLELKELFIGSEAGLIFATAFPDRRTLARYIHEITWETEVWIAESPTHLIHFDGERFLGPYEDDSDLPD